MPTTILDNETYPEALQRRYAEETKAEKQAEIIRMAEKACAPHQILNTDLVFLERFFNLAFAAGAAHEREACAKLAERFEPDEKCIYVEYASAAIRARNSHEKTN